MSQRVVTQLIDDLDGESEADETLSFALDGQPYEIELTDKNAAVLREALKPFVAVARQPGQKARRTPRANAAAANDGPSADEIRTWAREQKMTVSERGRISGEVRAAYDKAH